MSSDSFPRHQDSLGSMLDERQLTFEFPERVVRPEQQLLPIRGATLTLTPRRASRLAQSS